MPFGFYMIMAAQFFSALADNALLIASIFMLRQMQAPQEYEPLLKLFFTVSYVALAAFVGAFADSMPKWRVMFISNAIKIVGCGLMFFMVHPLLAYAVVGLGSMHVGEYDNVSALPYSNWLPAWDVGGGATGFLSDFVGVNWDVRRFQTLGGANTATGIGAEKLSFWRATMGFTFRL